MALIASMTIPKSSHWYMQSGEPFYTVPNKSKPGESRKPTLRDARKIGALPSVTNVLSILAKPGLDVWKREQAILSALTLPRRNGEDDHTFAHRVAEDSERESELAADFGTRIHRHIADYLNGKAPKFYEPTDKPFFDGWVKWWEANQSNLDNCVVDWKTQNYGDKDAVFYEEWLWQLAGYGFLVDELPHNKRHVEKSAVNLEWGYGGCIDFVDSPSEMPTLVSVAISSSIPGLVQDKRWSPDEAISGWEVFKCTLTLWKAIKDYQPATAQAF